MPSEKYMQMYKGYWPSASQHIFDLLKANIKESDCICEVGVASGHIMINLLLEGYDVVGYENRKEECEKTKRRFEENGIKGNIINEDIMNVQEKYDILYSTGLLQCFDKKNRSVVIGKFASLASKVIIVVPEIAENRYCGSEEKVGVAGCKEYQTGDLIKELEQYFKVMTHGKWESQELGIDESFLYFVCYSLRG